MNEIEVVTLMESSKTEQEWNSNCDKVKKAFADENGKGQCPDFWFQAINLSGVLKRTAARWGDDGSIKIERIL